MEVEDLYHLIVDPQSVTGQFILHQWVGANNEILWYNGHVDEFTTDTNEFKVSYDNEEGPIFLRPGEVIIDISSGELTLHSE